MTYITLSKVIEYGSSAPSFNQAVNFTSLGMLVLFVHTNNGAQPSATLDGVGMQLARNFGNSGSHNMYLSVFTGQILSTGNHTVAITFNADTGTAIGLLATNTPIINSLNIATVLNNKTVDITPTVGDTLITVLVAFDITLPVTVPSGYTSLASVGITGSGGDWNQNTYIAYRQDVGVSQQTVAWTTPTPNTNLHELVLELILVGRLFFVNPMPIG